MNVKKVLQKELIKSRIAYLNTDNPIDLAKFVLIEQKLKQHKVGIR